MSRWDAPSDIDYYAELDYHPRSVTYTCTGCDAPIVVAVHDGPLIGPPLCDRCAQDQVVERHTSATANGRA